MSYATLLSAIFAFTLLLVAIVHGTDDYMSFVSTEGIFIVILGTIAYGYMSYQARYMNLAMKACWDMMKKPRTGRDKLHDDILMLIKWAYIVQTKGVPALEIEVKNSGVTDQFMLYGADLVATGYKPEDVRSMLENAALVTYERNTIPVGILKNMAGAGPAFGMMGTLVGMVIMLGNLGSDMSKIGGALSVALTATLYGVVTARLFYMPAAEKLKQKEEIYLHRNEMVAEGFVMIAEKQSPRFMQDKLNSFLDPNMHFDIDTHLKNAQGAAPAATA